MPTVSEYQSAVRHPQTSNNNHQSLTHHENTNNHSLENHLILEEFQRQTPDTSEMESEEEEVDLKSSSPSDKSHSWISPSHSDEADVEEEKQEIGYDHKWDKKVINHSNFNASRSNDQLLCVEEEEYESEQDFNTGSAGFLVGTPVNEPIPEILTPEVRSDHEPSPQNMIKTEYESIPPYGSYKMSQKTKPEVQIMSNEYQSHNQMHSQPPAELHNTQPSPNPENNSHTELMTYYLSQEYETQIISMQRDVDGLFYDIDHYVNEELDNKHADFEIINQL